jgi:dihydroxy-acid dehydratase
MAMAGEFLGISPIQLTGVPAMSAGKARMPPRSRQARHGPRPRRPQALADHHARVHRNAIAAVCASGGSTNAVLHLIAIAKRAHIPLTVDDFDAISEKTPFICDLSPAASTSPRTTRTPAARRVLAARLVEKGLLHGNPHRHRQDPREEAALAERNCQPASHPPVVKPLKPTGGLVILKGNLAPEGCVVKVAGHERIHHTGTARVFDSEDDCFHAVEAGKINPERRPGHPLRRPARRPRHARDARRHRRHQRHPRALRNRRPLTDGRFSGATRGLMAGHVAPEAQLGGPIAAVHEGDTITFDIPGRKLTLNVPDAEIAARLKNFKAPAPRFKYARRLHSLCKGRRPDHITA